MPDAEEKLKPAWTGYDEMDAITATLAEIADEGLRRERQERILSIEDSVTSDERRLRELSEQIRATNARLGSNRAKLRELQTAPEPTANPDGVEHDIETMRHLPGVMGMRVVDGRIVVHVRTGVVIGHRRYDLGDFEITLGEPRGGYSLDIRTTNKCV